MMMLALASSLPAQISNVLTLNPPEKVSGKRNDVVSATFELVLRPGFHVNSSTPNDEYLIPLKFTWQDGSTQAVDVVFPKPQSEKYEFSEKPLSVYSGTFKVETKFKILPSAPAGAGIINGKLRYQACSDKFCLPPKNIDIKVPLFVRE
jgi:thiol:disulfide interchange protein DsbD